MNDDINVNAIADVLNTKIDIPDGKSQSDIDYVVDRQEPTASNNYTWYRKYKSGWVEQGWRQTWNGDWTTVTLPVVMANADYTCTAGGYRTDGSPYQQMTCFRNYTTTTVDMWSSDDSSSNAAEVRVLVVGIAAE